MVSKDARGINGFLTVSGDTLLIPVGVTGHPALYALRLNAQGKQPQGEKQPTTKQEKVAANVKPYPQNVSQPTVAPGLSEQEKQLIEQGHMLYMEYGARCHQTNGE